MTPGTTTAMDGPAGIKVFVTWGEEGPDGKHLIELVYPDDMPKDVGHEYYLGLMDSLRRAGVRVPEES